MMRDVDALSRGRHMDESHDTPLISHFGLLQDYDHTAFALRLDDMQRRPLAYDPNSFNVHPFKVPSLPMTGILSSTASPSTRPQTPLPPAQRTQIAPRILVSHPLAFAPVSQAMPVSTPTTTNTTSWQIASSLSDLA